jgi:hypothetical protein
METVMADYRAIDKTDKAVWITPLIHFFSQESQ